MLIAFSANNRRIWLSCATICLCIRKVKRNSNYQKWAHLLSFCCLTFVSTFITTRSKKEDRMLLFASVHPILFWKFREFVISFQFE